MLSTKFHRILMLKNTYILEKILIYLKKGLSISSFFNTLKIKITIFRKINIKNVFMEIFLIIIVL